MKRAKYLLSCLYLWSAASSLAMKPAMLDLAKIKSTSPAAQEYKCVERTFSKEGWIAKTLTGQIIEVSNSDARFALKIASTRLSYSHLENPLKELEILQKLKQDQNGAESNIVPLVDFATDQSNVWMVFPLASQGDLFQYVEKHKPVDLSEIQILFADFAAGLKFIHDRGIAHLDISPENCLITWSEEKGRNILLITDFGVAQNIVNGPFSAIDFQPGKRMYQAPEILGCEENFNPLAADIWSAGVLFYGVVTGLGFAQEACERCRVFAYFIDNGLRGLLEVFSESIPHKVPAALVDLLEGMLVIEPNKRINADQIINHKYFMQDF